VTSTVFLDRDGTLNVKAPEGSYVASPADLILLPGAADAVRRLNRAGIFVVLVTNQRGLARGLVSPGAHSRVMERLTEELASAGAHIDAAYVCPHEKGSCDCRKPAPGLLLQAAWAHPDIDFGDAVTVGDAESDIGAGMGAGTGTIRLATGPVVSRADHVAPDLGTAVSIILRENGLVTTRRHQDMHDSLALRG
jgi:D-glycero-D-manno-heptose 1,7-bisphosphate phosphatase